MISTVLLILSLLAQHSGPFKNELDAYLKKNLSGCEGYQYEVVQMPDSYKKIEIINRDDFNKSGSMIYIPVKILGKDGRNSRAIVTVRLQIFKTVLVAARKINRGENLSASDFELKKIDIAQLSSPPVSKDENFNIYRSSNFLRQGQPLTKDDIELRPVLNSGDPVTAEYKTGSVFITFQAVTRQEGIPGETITIITKDKRLFKAKVIDSHNVNIIE